MLEVVHPGWLTVGLLTCLLAAWLPRYGIGPGADLSPSRRRWVILIRCLILLLLWSAFAGVRQLLPSDRLTVFFLVDRSLSARRQEGFARDYIARALPHLKPHQEVAIITFGGEAMLDVPPSRFSKVPSFTTIIDRNQSDLASAIRFACAGLPAQSSGRLVLLSDGQETRGDAVAEAEMAHRMGLEVAVVPLPESGEAEILIESIKAPDRVRPQAPFEVGVTIESTREDSECELVLERNQRSVGRQRVKLKRGKNFFLLPQKASQPELLNFEARIESKTDTELANNRAQTSVMVEGPSRLLYVVGLGRSRPALADRLSEGGLVVDVLPTTELPSDLASWQNYQAVILDNVSALDLSALQIDWITALVREAGIGLTMLGGSDSYGAGGYHGSSLAEALPVALDIKKRKNTPAVAMIYVIDKSGSMGEMEGGVERLAMAREAAISSIEMMSPEDAVGVIGFDSAFKWVVRLQKVENSRQIAASIATLRPGGGTSLFGGLEAAIRTLAASDAPVKHVLVLTDGQVEPANFDLLTVEANKKHITISTVAVGGGADTQFLGKLASKGKGRSYLANSASALPRVFTRDTVLASRSAFVEKPTRPTLVESHPILRGIDVGQAPPLLGYNLVSAKGPPHQVLLTGVDQDPLLAAGRFGLGKVVAFTSDSGRAWSKPWTAWPGFSQMLLQAVRWTLPEAESNTMQFRLESHGDQRLKLTAHAPMGVTQPQLEVGLVSPTGQGSRIEMKQVGTRKFEGFVDANQAGAWLIHAGGSAGQTISWTRSFSIPYSRELAAVGSNRPRLQAIAAAAKSAYDPSPEKVLEPLQTPRRFSEEIWPQLLMAALLLLPIEVALRRVHVRLPRLRFSRAHSASTEATPELVTSNRLLESRRKMQERIDAGRVSLKAPSTPAAPPASPPPPASAPAPPQVQPASSDEDPLERLKRARKRSR